MSSSEDESVVPRKRKRIYQLPDDSSTSSSDDIDNSTTTTVSPVPALDGQVTPTSDSNSIDFQNLMTQRIDYTSTPRLRKYNNGTSSSVPVINLVSSSTSDDSETCDESENLPGCSYGEGESVRERSSSTERAPPLRRSQRLKSGYESEVSEVNSDSSVDHSPEKGKELSVSEDEEDGNGKLVSEEEEQEEECNENSEREREEVISSSGSDSVSGAENELDDELNVEVRIDMPGIPQARQEDSLVAIQIPELDQMFNYVEPNVEETVYSHLEFRIYIYKLSPQGRRIDFIPTEFVERVRDLDIRISARRFDSNDNSFYFQMNLEIYNSVISILSALKIQPEREEEVGLDRAVTALSRYYERNRALQNTDVATADFLLQFDQLSSYQLEVVRFAINRNGRCMLADEAGMGKRIEAIVTALYYRDEWPILIVCSPSRVVDWKNELGKFNVQESDIAVVNETVDSSDLPKFDPKKIPPVIIITYTTSKYSKSVSDIKEFQKEFPISNVLILDECHKIKHANTKNSIMLRRLAKRSKRRLLLTSNPAGGVPKELFRQLHTIDRHAFKDYIDFALQYCGLIEKDGKFEVSYNWRHARNLEELRHILFGTVVIRNFRANEYTLPKLYREKIILDFQCDERTRRLLGTVCFQEAKEERENLEMRGTSMFKWYKRSGIAKLLEICKYLDSINYEENKIIIYARHRKVIDGIKQLLTKKGVKFISFTQAKDYDTRSESSDEFNANPEIRVAILSLEYSKICIDFKSANFIIFTELYWIPDSLFRNEARSFHLKSSQNPDREIEVKYLICDDTSDDGKHQLHIDCILWEMLIGKMDVLCKLGFLRPEDAFAKDIPWENFKAVPSNVVDDLELSGMSSDEASDEDYNPENEDGLGSCNDDDDELEETGSEFTQSENSSEENSDIDNIPKASEADTQGNETDNSSNAENNRRESDADASESRRRNSGGADDLSNEIENETIPATDTDTPSRRVTRSQSALLPNNDNSDSDDDNNDEAGSGSANEAEKENTNGNSSSSEDYSGPKHVPVKNQGRRFETLGSSDTDDGIEKDSDTEGSLKEFVEKDSSDSEDEEKEYLPCGKKNKKFTKRKSKEVPTRNEGSDDDSSESDEDSGQATLKTSKLAKKFFL